MFTSIPFSISKTCTITQEKDEAEHIRSFLNLIVNSSLGSCECDPDFGFVFKNYRFENIDESKEMLMSYGESEFASPIRKHKIHGDSSESNQSTFANDLYLAISKYEPRLRNVDVNMKYYGPEKMVVLLITGSIGNIIVGRFVHKIKIHVW